MSTINFPVKTKGPPASNAPPYEFECAKVINATPPFVRSQNLKDAVFRASLRVGTILHENAKHNKGNVKLAAFTSHTR